MGEDLTDSDVALRFAYARALMEAQDDEGEPRQPTALEFDVVGTLLTNNDVGVLRTEGDGAMAWHFLVMAGDGSLFEIAARFWQSAKGHIEFAGVRIQEERDEQVTRRLFSTATGALKVEGCETPRFVGRLGKMALARKIRTGRVATTSLQD